MKNLLNTIKWDAVLIYKFGIITIALIISLMYSIGLILSNTTGLEKVVSVLIFSDPVMYGFLFTALLILFEKGANIHQALAVTPMPISHYVWSKAIVFTILAFICSSLIILAARPDYFNFLAFFPAVILSSSLFVFIGIIGTSYIDNFNQFILLMPIVLAPICLPFLAYFNLYHSGLFYIIPSHACLLLFKASVEPITIWQWLYALVFLIMCNILCYKLAIRHYKVRILKTSYNE